MVEKAATRFKQSLIPLGILLISLAATFAGWQAARNDRRHDAQMEFTRIAQSCQDQLERRMELDFRFLADLSSFLEASDHATYRQFVHFINHANTMMNIGSIQQVGYIPWNGDQGETAYQAAPPAGTLSDGRRSTAGNNRKPRARSYAYSGNSHVRQAPWDAEAFKRPVLREAWQKARDWDQVVAARTLDPSRAGQGQPYFLLIAPVYRDTIPPYTVALRRAAFQGLAYESFRSDELLKAAWGAQFEDSLDVRFAVEDVRGRFTTLYDSWAPGDKADSFVYTGRFDAAGRQWLLSIRSPMRTYLDTMEALPLSGLLGGVLTSLLLTAVSAMWVERRRAAKVQQEQDERFRSLFDQNPDAVYSLDLHGNFTTANRQTERLAGKPAEQLLNLSARAMVAPDKREESFRRLALALHGQPTYGETAILKQNGERVELGVTNLPIVVDGKLVGVFGVAKDITARKRAEAALQAAHAELEDRVRQRTAALRLEVEARKQTEAALRDLASHLRNVREDERTRIAREIHDELGGALAAIKFDLSLSRRRCDASEEQLRQRTQESLRLVDNAITSLRRIMADLRPSMLDDLGLWATCEWLAQEFETRMGIPVLFKLDGEEVEIAPGLATAIFRIVQESLNNVAKHAQASLVEITAVTAAHTIRISIRDNGQGFLADRKGQTESYGLLGMRERAQAFNGRVDIKSQPGMGAVVFIEFPV